MKITIWFCASEDTELKQLINQFSIELGTPIFNPHITLLGSVNIEDPSTYCKAVKDACSLLHPIEITLEEIAFENIKWRCFYYKAYPTKPLSSYHHLLFEKLRYFNTRINKQFMPHLSLIYDDLSLEQQELLKLEHQDILKQRKLIFDTIKVVHFKPTDIKGWKVLESFSL